MNYWLTERIYPCKKAFSKETDMSTRDDQHRLYVIMRTDVASLGTPGKSGPQFCHAQSEATAFHAGNGATDAQRAAYAAWQAQSSFSFGSTIAKGAGLPQILNTLDTLKAMGVPCGLVVDETYPLPDGDVVHLLEMPTCAWCFGDKTLLAPLLGHIPLL